MSLGIFDLIRSLTTNAVVLTEKTTSALVLTVTAVETTARTLNHTAEMAEVAVVATKSEMEAEYAETMQLMQIESEARIKSAKSLATPSKTAKAK